MLGTDTVIGNPYACQTLNAEQDKTPNLTQDAGLTIADIVFDLEFRGTGASNPDRDITHTGNMKILSKQQVRWPNRRPAAVPAIVRLKSDHRTDHRWLQRALCDALHSIRYAADYNLRWLLGLVVRKGLAASFFQLLQASQLLQRAIGRS